MRNEDEVLEITRGNKPWEFCEEVDSMTMQVRRVAECPYCEKVVDVIHAHKIEYGQYWKHWICIECGRIVYIQPSRPGRFTKMKMQAMRDDEG